MSEADDDSENDDDDDDDDDNYVNRKMVIISLVRVIKIMKLHGFAFKVDNMAVKGTDP